MATLPDEIARRRTFAIISHPDAGKTTLTEKLLLFGGAIQLAGEVKARGERRRARSDWMAIERERGISVSSAVMTLEHDGVVFNLLDTPGHQDFSEDTYRTLTAVDTTPASWPIGMGRDFLGTYDLFDDALLLFERGLGDQPLGERFAEPIRCRGLDDPVLAQ